VFTRTQYSDTFLTTMLPALRAVTMNQFNRYPDEYNQVFNVEDSERSIEQFSEVTGFGTLDEIAEGEPIHYDDPIQAFNKTYTHRKFGKGYKVTQEAIDDDKFRIIKNLAGELGKSAKETIEIEAALIFNRGFNASYTGPDGKVLFATDHPNVGGGSQANRPTVAVDLDVPALEAALGTFRGWTDHRGKKVRVVPTKLVVPGALEFTAAKLLGGTMETGTANHTINAFRQRSGMKSFNDWMVWNYLTDDDAWFVMAEKSDLAIRFFWRKRFQTVSDRDFDSDSVKTAGRMRFSVGWDQWLGAYGSPGA
jgi:phage major head subunit gpT-like protein